MSDPAHKSLEQSAGELAEKVAGPLTVGEQRACEAELSELRLAWKRNPSAFSADLLEMLKRIASLLAQGAPDGGLEPLRRAIQQLVTPGT